MLVATRSCGVGWEHVLCFIEWLFPLVHPSLCIDLCLSSLIRPTPSLPSVDLKSTGARCVGLAGSWW